MATFRATGRYDVKSPNCNIYKAIYPQALRMVSPATVNTIIELIKDSTIVTIIGLFDLLGMIMVIYTVLSGLAVVGAFAGLLFGLRSAFMMEATQARTIAIFYAMGGFVGGLVVALTFFAFREAIRLLLAIEENTRPE